MASGSRVSRASGRPAPSPRSAARFGRMPSMSAQNTTPGEELRHLFLGYRVSQAIHVLTELGIADLLAVGPRSADDLAAASGAHAPSLYRVLRLAASEGVFAQMD